MNTFRSDRRSGFALLIVLALLAMLVMAVYCLSVLVRVSGQTYSTASYQTQARQNALLSLSVALGELQRTAAKDNATTALGEITATAGNRQKRWTGVWSSTGFEGWLVSGTPTSFAASSILSPVLLVGENSAGSESPSTPGKEYVEVPRIAVPMLPNASGASAVGSYGYWVGDEGVKLTMIAADDLNTAVGSVPSSALMRLDPTQIFSTFTPDDPATLNVVTYGQLTMVKSGLQLANNFHFATVTAYGVSDGLPRGARTARYKATHGGSSDLLVSGAVNVNTTNADVWKAVSRLACSNLGLVAPGATRQTNFANAMIAKIRATGPFLSLTQLRNSGAWDDAIATLANPRPTVTDVEASLDPLLFSRSDTFRIRSYGDAFDSSGSPTIVATAFCEAIVQRLPEAAPTGGGRRFKITSFRWLGPDDI